MATIVINSWFEIGLRVNPNSTNTKTLCPTCSEGRKNSRDKCLSVSGTNGVANCKHCGVIYVIRKDNMKEYKRPEVTQLPVSEKTISFFKSRGIENRVIEYFKITDSMEWMSGKKESKDGVTRCINFNYFQDHELVNVKFRGSEKRFKLCKDAKLVFYNIDAIKDEQECVIVEGEIDNLTAYQCSIFNCISVPNGASKGNQKLEYLDNCIHYFENKTKIVLATDDDDAGRSLREELIRRLDREICWTIDYPEGCKDCNEVLLKYGERAVKDMIKNARPLPLEGVFDAEELSEQVNDIYDNGFPEGAKIGYRYFDELMSFMPGEFTIIVGLPGHGKSDWSSQIMVRLAARHGWRFAIFSPENTPRFHAIDLVQKFIGGKMVGKDKVSIMKKDKGLQFVNDHFFFMKVDEIDVTIDGILKLAKELVKKKGINHLYIDPYNYIEHKIPHGYSETQYISELLTKIVVFGKQNNIHIFLIVHPTKMQKDKETKKYNVATLYDASGSSHFFNKAYNGMSVYRNFEEKTVDVHVQKIKYKFVGKVGMATFTYDYDTGRYATEGEGYESELDRYLAMQSQEVIEFKEEIKENREIGVLTDISRMHISSSFDEPKQDSIFKFTEQGELKPNLDIETPF